MSYWKNTTTTFLDGPTVDSFGALRVTQPRTIFDSKLLSNDGPLLWDRIISGSTANYSWASPIATYVVSSSGDYTVAQTRRRMIYEAGQSHKILMTFVLGAPAVNSTARVGYFNSTTVAPYSASYDGIYLERDGASVNLCVGNVGIIESVSQSLWNVDPCNGSGPSGINLDFTKSQILFIDFQWLGVGRIRIGFVVNGTLTYVHQFEHSNLIGGVYMTSPNHSLRYELRSSGAISSLSQICAAVMTEGTVTNDGIVTSVSSNRAGVTVSTTDTALIGVRLRSGSLNQSIVPIDYSIISTATSSANYQYNICINPTINGQINWSSSLSSSYEYARGSATSSVANMGTVVESGWVGTTIKQSTGTVLPSVLQLGSSISGSIDQCWLVLYSLNSVSFLGSLGIRET